MSDDCSKLSPLSRDRSNLILEPRCKVLRSSLKSVVLSFFVLSPICNAQAPHSSDGAFAQSLSATDAFTIYGRVTDSSGALVSQAQVGILDGKGRTLGQAVSDSLGRYRLRISRPAVAVCQQRVTATGFQARAGFQGSLLDAMPAMAAMPVAEAAYRGLMAGRRRVTPGLTNKLSVAVAPFVPHAIVLPLSSANPNFLNADLRAAIARAEQDLLDTAAGLLAVSLPADPLGADPVASTGTIQVVRVNRRQATRDTLRGL